MDRNKAKELSDVLLAYSQGKTIQILIEQGCSWNGSHVGCDTWFDLPNLPMQFYKNEYRVKPEPKLVPFTFEDNLLFKDKWVKLNNTSLCRIVRFSKESVSIANELNINSYSYIELLRYAKFEDNSPCGKYIEE
jgi:hypothetical protein